MQLKEIKTKVNGRNFTVQFVNDYKDTRTGFAHVTTLLVNGIEWSNNRCNYLNRTWECYTYQTVMIGACNNFINDRQDSIKEYIKRQHNTNRITKTIKPEYEKAIKEDAQIKLMKKVIEKLR